MVDTAAVDRRGSVPTLAAEQFLPVLKEGIKPSFNKQTNIHPSAIFMNENFEISKVQVNL